LVSGRSGGWGSALSSLCDMNMDSTDSLMLPYRQYGVSRTQAAFASFKGLFLCPSSRHSGGSFSLVALDHPSYSTGPPRPVPSSSGHPLQVRHRSESGYCGRLFPGSLTVDPRAPGECHP
jgi:hypothetical protein